LLAGRRDPAPLSRAHSLCSFAGDAVGRFAPAAAAVLSPGDPPFESKRVFRELQIHAVVIRTNAATLATITLRSFRANASIAASPEGHHRIDRGDMLDAGAARDRREIRDAGGRVRVEPSSRKQAAVVEDDVKRFRGR